MAMYKIREIALFKESANKDVGKVDISVGSIIVCNYVLGLLFSTNFYNFIIVFSGFTTQR